MSAATGSNGKRDGDGEHNERHAAHDDADEGAQRQRIAARRVYRHQHAVARLRGLPIHRRRLALEQVAHHDVQQRKVAAHLRGVDDLDGRARLSLARGDRQCAPGDDHGARGDHASLALQRRVVEREDARDIELGGDCRDARDGGISHDNGGFINNGC
eukprot:TRINITY_DN10758_c0_g1_i1.p2 TRINITY_DN10758_c0_g1~~TRINITY_DN10758_c0_g1_i1.p2  ORF type:complete len:158 (+),score=2.02 TRINITY_DN10758_c0_g1_i1:55-528(+)